jgi:hypothetical protein
MAKFDLVGHIIGYEAGELRGQEVLNLFSRLIIDRASLEFAG